MGKRSAFERRAGDAYPTPIEAVSEETATLLQQAMTEAFAATFPGAPLNQLVKVAAGRTWCEAKDDVPSPPPNLQ